MDDGWTLEAGATVLQAESTPQDLSPADVPVTAVVPALELPPWVTVSAVAEFGSLIGEPARVSMLMALLSAETLSARELADAAGITPPTASSHIARLLAAGILTRHRQGRLLLHRFADVPVRDLVRIVYLGGAHLSSPAPANPKKQGNGNLMLARACGSHLAGRLGVELTDVLTDGDSRRFLVPRGRELLLKWGLDSAALRARPCACPSCIDWSEGRPHIAGQLGRAILDRGMSLGWIRRRDQDRRQLVVTRAGLIGFRVRFGVLSNVA